MTVDVGNVHDQRTVSGGVGLIGRGGGSAPAITPSPGWPHVVAGAHYLLVLLDAVAINHPQLRIRLDELKPLGLELLVDRVNDSLVPQALRGMRAGLPGISVKLGEVGATVPINVDFLCKHAGGNQQCQSEN